MTWQVFMWRWDPDRKRLGRDYFGDYEGPRPDVGRTIQLRWLPNDGQTVGDLFLRERVVRVKPQVRQLHTMARSTGQKKHSSMWIRIWRASAKRIDGSWP